MDPVATKVVWNPFTEGYFQNPYQHLRHCRETNPVQQGHHGEWILFRYDHIKEVLRSPDFSTSELTDFFRKKEPVIFKNTTQCPYLARTTSHWLPYLNGSTHEAARQLIERTLSRFNLKSILSDCLREFDDEYMQGKSFDATELGAALPVLLFNALYGGPWNTKEGVLHLQKVSHSFAVSQDIFVPIKTYQSINEDMQWFFDTVHKDFELNIADRPLLSYLEEENRIGKFGFSIEAMTSMIGILLLGSIETTQISISTIIYEMMKDRRLIQYITDADEIMVNVLSEEFFRYITPQQYTIRINDKDLHLNGNDIPAGSRLFLCLAAANRDPSVFETPDQIVLDRKNNPHLSFGSGVHSCVGSKLARMEMRGFLKPLASAMMNYKLDAATNPEWHRSIFIRGFKGIRIIRL
jgi:cytochrome P450